MKDSTKSIETQSALIDDRNFLREIVGRFLQNILEKEFVEQIGASRYERNIERQFYRNGIYERA